MTYPLVAVAAAMTITPLPAAAAAIRVTAFLLILPNSKKQSPPYPLALLTLPTVVRLGRWYARGWYLVHSIQRRGCAKFVRRGERLFPGEASSE